MTIKYKGFVIKQSNYNNHIMVFKDKKMVMHLSATEKFTKNDLKLIVDFWLI